MNDTVKKRFERNFSVEPKTGCWLWNGYVSKSGYVRFKFRSTMFLAHRVSWILYRGEIPKGSGHHGICVLHKCDVRKCVNPDHLFLGTQSDNVQDCIKKKRHRAMCGENHGNSKLTMIQVRKIRKMRKKNPSLTYKKIGSIFGVSEFIIWGIITNLTYREI